jgi:hypothetical protein
LQIGRRDVGPALNPKGGFRVPVGHSMGLSLPEIGVQDLKLLVEPMVMPIAKENAKEIVGDFDGERLKGICFAIAPHISKDFHYALLDIPNHAIHDFGYIHFHLFTVWFFSKFNIPIPNDLHAIYISHFSLFPFFSSLFHIQNNLSL